jgi:hypothetical protein
MTAQEKAKELVNKFDGVGLQMRNEAIACALIAVDEILNAIKLIPYGMQYLIARDYFEEVKQEIELL